MRTFPEGAVWLLSRMACTTWSGVRLWDLSKRGSTLMTMDLVLPPKGAGEINPGMEENEDRMYTFAISANSLLLRVGLLRTICPTGRVDASKRMIKGGCVPGGMMAWALFVKAVTSAAAW